MKKYTIAHFSDLHIRLASRHEEYRKVIDRMVEQMNNNDPDLIVFTGDLFHTKVHLSPEAYDMAKYLYDQLIEIAPNILIKGNHDENQGNSSRQDAISPFVQLFNADKPENKQLIYYKDSGVYQYNEDIQFFVYPMNDGEVPDLNKINKDKIDIALYHGIVSGTSTNSGWKFKEDDQKISIPWSKFSSGMCGDIHKHQMIKEHVGMVGSTIQQNWGEHPTDHGFLIWEFEDNRLKDTTFHRVKNDYGYYKVKHVDGEFETEYDSFPPKATIKVIYQTDDIQSDVKEKFIQEFDEIEKLKFEEEGVDVEGNAIDVKQDIINLHNFENQQKTVKDFFEGDKDIQEITELNEEIFEDNKSEFDQDAKRSIFDIGYIDFDNTFCYGQNNKFIFSEKHGVIGFFSPNRSGKSSFLDTISFAIYGETPHTSTYDDIINRSKDEYYTYITLQNQTGNYSIERMGKRSGDSWRNNLTFTIYDSDGNVLEEESDMREAKTKIEQLFGDAKTYQKTAYIYQDNNERFLNLTPARRKEWLYNNLGLEVFEILHESAKKKSKDKKNRLQYLQSLDIKQILNEKRIAKGELAENEEDLEEEIDKIEKQLQFVETDIDGLRDKKKPVDDSLEDQSDNIKKTNQKIKDNHSIINNLQKITEDDIDIPEKFSDKKGQIEHDLESMQSTGYDHKLDEEKKKEKKLKEVLQKGKNIKEKIENKEKELEVIKNKLSKIDGDDIDQKIEKLDEEISKKWSYINKIETLEGKISSYKDKASVLNEDERFQNEDLCQTCPLLDEARQRKNELPELKEKLQLVKQKSDEVDEKENKLEKYKKIKNEFTLLTNDRKDVNNRLEILRNKRENLLENHSSIKNDLKSLEDRRKEIIDQKIENKKSKYKEIKNKISIHKKEKLNEIKEKITTKQHEIEKLESKLTNLKKTQKKYKKQLEVIENNKKLDQQIEDLKSDKYKLQDEKNELDDKLIDLKSRINTIDNKLQELNQQYEELRDLKEEYRIYKKYIEATHKDQLPLQIITSMLGIIQSEVNNVVSQITDFRLRLFVENDNVVVNIIDEKGERSATRLSGMERFTCNLAFRIAIAQIGNMAVPNWLIVDEGFSSVDSTNSEEFPNMFRYLKKKFGFLMVVSHDERMRDMVDYNIEINTENKFAKLYE